MFFVLPNVLLLCESVRLLFHCIVSCVFTPKWYNHFFSFCKWDVLDGSSSVVVVFHLRAFCIIKLRLDVNAICWLVFQEIMNWLQLLSHPLLLPWYFFYKHGLYQNNLFLYIGAPFPPGRTIISCETYSHCFLMNKNKIMK